MSSETVLKSIKEQIMEIIPSDANITKIEFEGPEVAIYSKNISVLADAGSVDLITSIARKIRKRVVFRSDPSIRKEYEEVKQIINEILKDQVEVGDIDFDDSLGEVIIHVDKPKKIYGRDAKFLQEIIKQTLWRPKIYRISPAGL